MFKSDSERDSWLTAIVLVLLALIATIGGVKGCAISYDGEVRKAQACCPSDK